MNSAICEAIRLRHLLNVTYDGRRRVIEPYSHGVARDGREVLVAFQRAGESGSGQSQGWKAFHVERLSAVADMEVPFIANQAEYRSGGHSKNLASVHCCV